MRKIYIKDGAFYTTQKTFDIQIFGHNLARKLYNDRVSVYDARDIILDKVDPLIEHGIITEAVGVGLCLAIGVDLLHLYKKG